VHRLGWLGQPLAPGALLFLTLLGASLFATRVNERPLASVAVAVFAPLYTAGLLTFGYLLRHHPWTVSAAAGTALVGFPVVTTWLSDIGAYFVGRALGRTRLMPEVSPGKTRAGALGALLFAALGAMAYDQWVLQPYASFGLGWGRAAAFALAISAVGQIGDLVKSLFKREAGVKDSGRLLAGHGGALDRLDSLLFALPVTYFLLGTLARAAFPGTTP
jgi:phosphatidate cytidylyltransferase